MSIPLPPPAERRPLYFALLLASGLLLAWCLSELTTRDSYGPQKAAEFSRDLLALILFVPGLAGVVVGAAQLSSSRVLRGLAIGLLVLVMGEFVLVLLGTCLLLSSGAGEPGHPLVVVLWFLIILGVEVGCYLLISDLHAQRSAAEAPTLTEPAEPTEPTATE